VLPHFLGDSAPATTVTPGLPTLGSRQVDRRDQPHGDEGIQFSLTEVAKRIATGRLDPHVRAWTTRRLAEAGNPKGPVARAKVLLSAVRGPGKNGRWVPDPTDAEFMPAARDMVETCKGGKTNEDGSCPLGEEPPTFALGDCFAEGTLMLADGHEIVAVESLREGMRIWGLNRWSTVLRVAYKGTLSIDVVSLNNGSDLKLTTDHHVYVLDCKEHPMLDDDEAEPGALPTDRHWRGGSDRWGCSCGHDARVEKRTRVAELREGMVMPAPERIPFGSGAMDPDRAWVEGVFVADGWAENSRFAISGKDGHPKEAQKRAVASACERLGIHTRWHERYIAVNDGDWALRMQQMGHRAPNKHLLSVNLDEGAAAATLRGVMADSGENTRGGQRTFTTTSRALAVQVRLLHKMFGVTCGWRHIEDHGGLGSNSIYRLGTRGNDCVDGRHAWTLRVRSIDRAVAHVPCWDITTDDHRVYLAEHDVTVSQCDDLSIQLGSSILAPMMMLAAGGNVGVYGAIVGHAYTREKMIEHVLCAIWGEGQWWYCDPSMTSLKFGECKPYTRERAIYVPSLDLACDADVCLAPGGAASNGPPIPVRGDFVGLSLGEELQFPPDARGFRYVATDRGVGLGRAIDLTATELDARLFAGSR